MQIFTGLISIDDGTNVVTGNGDVDWSQVTVGSVFITNNQSFRINSINLGTSTLVLDGNYDGGGLDRVDGDYVIVRDFTVNHQFPLLNRGDLEAAVVYSRMVQMLDSLLGSVNSADTATIVSKTGHRFIIGNVVRLNGSSWELATSSSETTAAMVGMVSSIVDANTFAIVTQGRITGVTGISLTAGRMYYLRSTLLDTGSGGPYVNICDSSNVSGNGGGTLNSWTYTGTLHVPVLIADGSGSGFLLSFAASASGVFGQDRVGTVPGPTSIEVAAGKVLGAGGGWVAQSVSNGSIAAQHLLASANPADWDVFAARGTGSSILTHMLQLNSRLETAEAKLLSLQYKEQVLYPGQSWTVPASGVSSVFIRFERAIRRRNTTVNRAPTFVDAEGYVITGRLAVAGGQVLSFEETLTSGGSQFFAIHKLKKAGAEVIRVGSNTEFPVFRSVSLASGYTGGSIPESLVAIVPGVGFTKDTVMVVPSSLLWIFLGLGPIPPSSAPAGVQSALLAQWQLENPDMTRVDERAVPSTSVRIAYVG